MKAQKRHTLNLGEPALYVLVDAPKPANGPRFGPSFAQLGEQIQTVHVMSPAVGGEVRGYWIARGALHVRYPVTPHEWPEVDAEVSRVLGMEVRA